MFEFLKNVFDFGADDGRRDRGAQRYDESDDDNDNDPRYGGNGYGGNGYFGNSDSGGQSYNGAQRLYPGDPGYRAHPTRPVHSSSVGGWRGMKAYDRPDDRVLGDVCDRLAMESDVDVSEVTVEVAAGVVKLGGTVEDRYERRTIEEIVESVSGVRDIENGIRVQQRSGSDAMDTPSPERTLNRS